jgi:hypothetical protein
MKKHHVVGFTTVLYMVASVLIVAFKPGSAPLFLVLGQMCWLLALSFIILMDSLYKSASEHCKDTVLFSIGK